MWFWFDGDERACVHSSRDDRVEAARSRDREANGDINLGAASAPAAKGAGAAFAPGAVLRHRPRGAPPVALLNACVTKVRRRTPDALGGAVGSALSLGLMAVFGIVAGLVMNLGGRWMATVVLLVLLALFIQFMIWLFGVMI